MMDNNEDAMTHGVTVMECEEKYRLKYYRYLLMKRHLKHISPEYFKELAEDYETYRINQTLKKS